ncbi:MAG: VOC family protein, partial [Gemmatimonadota bacterium]|nr:VOC family protein [Gemmatimonadota bacterium]
TDHGPPEGFHTVTPLLLVRDAERAIRFYRDAFGAEEVMRLTMPDGTVVHAEIRIRESVVMLAEEAPDRGDVGPQTLGGTSCRVHLYVEDVDAMVERAVTTGAEVEIPLQDQFYGDRTARLSDPFGHLWIVSTRTEDMSAAEMQRRLDAWAAENG